MNDGTDRDGGDQTADRVVRVLRRAGVVEHRPPPHVWEAVVRTVRGSQAPGGLRAVGGAPGSTVAEAESRSGAPRGRSAAAAAQLLATAAVGALVTWAGFALTDRETPAQVLADAELEALTADGAGGRAEVVDVDGRQRLRVSLADRPDAGDGYLEVWLLRPDVSGMVTLGVLEGDTGEFLLPEGLDLSEYAVVDISREHVDGDPGHGGDSLVRGEVG